MDEAAISEEEGLEETEREQEKLGLRGGRQAGTLRRGDSGAGGAAEGGQRVLEELRRLQRQECIGVFIVHSDAGGDLHVRTRV